MEIKISPLDGVGSWFFLIPVWMLARGSQVLMAHDCECSIIVSLWNSITTNADRSTRKRFKDFFLLPSRVGQLWCLKGLEWLMFGTTLQCQQIPAYFPVQFLKTIDVICELDFRRVLCLLNHAPENMRINKQMSSRFNFDSIGYALAGNYRVWSSVTLF